MIKMISKTFSALIIVFTAISCNVSKQDEVNSKLNNFTETLNPELRENVWKIEVVEKNGNLVLQGETDHPEWKKELLEQLQPENITDEIILLPDSTVGEKTMGLINLSVANLRYKPNHSAEMATQAWLGTPVKILKKQDDWFLVQTPDKYISWVDGDGIELISEIQFTHWKNADKIIFTGEDQSVYNTENSEIPVSDITMGNILEKVDESQSFFNVKFPDGRSGFVSKKNWVDFNRFKNEIIPDTLTIHNMAIKLTGRPYFWGGTSNRAMDCSGFIKVIYFMNGLILARDASLQTKYGELIDIEPQYSPIQTGDLLFFGRKETENQPEKVTHVALSLGGTEYIHASGRIKQNSFNPESYIYSEYRKNSFVRARRIIGNNTREGIVAIKEHPWY